MSREKFDIEEEYKRFADFGLVGGLAVCILGIHLVLREAFVKTWLEPYVPFLSLSFLILLLPFLVGFACVADAGQSWIRKRSLRERLIAASIVGTIIIAVGATILYL